VERSLRDVIGAMLAASGVNMEIRVDPQRLRSLEQRRMRGSFAKLKTDTGWKPEIPFEQTLIDTLDYWDKEDAT
jgi:GDP-4-dehydro-6-deoxy-D-mannose reductase